MAGEASMAVMQKPDEATARKQGRAQQPSNCLDKMLADLTKQL